MFTADLRHAIRSLVRRPAFAATAILTIAAGLGVNATVFHVVYSVLLKPLPFRDPDRIMQVWETHPQFRTLQASIPDFLDWRASVRSFEQMEAYTFQAASTGVTLFGAGEPERVQAPAITAGLFPMMGIRPLIGSTFDAADDHRKRNVVLVSERLWRTVFHADAGLPGRSIRLDDQAFTVIGIIPDRQRFPAWADVWLPFSIVDSQLLETRRFHPVEVVGRLKHGATVAQAQSEIDVLAKRLAATYPTTNGSIGGFVIPLSGQITGQIRPALLIAWAAAGLVLLIACANLAQLVLARTADRSVEFDTRAALGASKTQLIRAVVAENLVIALAGALLSIALSMTAMPLIRRFATGDVPRMESATYGADAWVSIFALAAFCVLLFALPACWQVLRTHSDQGAWAATRMTQSRVRRRFSAALISLEVALAFVVLTAAGLLIRSFSAIMNEDPGFRADRVLTTRLKLPARYDWNKAQSLFNDMLAPRIMQLPGIEAVASSNSIPMSLGPTERSRYATRFGVPGVTIESGNYPVAQLRWVSEDYFRVLGMRLISGRLFNAADRGKNRYVVNRALAEQYFPNQDPAGRQLIMNVGTAQPTTADIAGVVSDVRDLGLDIPPQPTLYVVGSSPGLVVLVRTSDQVSPDPAAIANTIRSVDSEIVVDEIRPLTDAIAGSLAERRLAMWLIASFAGLAALLSAVGIYGLMAYSVASRVREFGIRAALGARPLDLSRMLLGESALLAVSGIAAGSLASLVLIQAMKTMLYHVSAGDPLSRMSAAAGLLIVAIASAAVPALRAFRISAAEALRRE
jgi:predicted permease